MSYNSKYTGEQVEALLDIVSQGGGTGGEGGEVQKTTEAEILAMGFTKNQGTITEVKMNGVSKGTSGVVDLGTVITEHQDISGKVDKVTGKQLSTEDFTTLLKQKLDGLSNYDDTEIQEAVSKLRTDLDTLVSGDTTTAIKTFNEVIAFLDGLEDTEDLASIIASIEQQIAAKGTYSKPTTGIPRSDLASAVQTALDKADTALQSVPSEYVTETELNNKGYATSSQLNTGFGNMEQKLQIINGELASKQPTLVSGTNIKTINGNSILGSGNIVIEGGNSSNGGLGNYPVVITDASFIEAQPNTYYIIEGGTSEVEFYFLEPIEGIVNEYIVEFMALNYWSGESCMLHMPDTIVWANG